MDASVVGPNLDILTASEALNRVCAHNGERLASGRSDGLVRSRLTFAGSEVVGSPVKLDAKGSLVVLTDGGVAYLDTSGLQCVEVLGVEPMIDALSVPPPPSQNNVVPAQSPPRSELRDTVAQLNEKLESRFGFTIDADVLDDARLTDLGKNQFVPFLETLEAAFDDIGSDDVGEITLSSLDRAALALGDELIVKRSGSVMVIAAPLNTTLEPTLRSRLDTMLEANL